MPLLKDTVLNGRSYRIHYFTGSVVDVKKWSETEVSGTGGGGHAFPGGQQAPVYMDVRSKTKRMDQIILKNKEGKEQSFVFQDWEIACREGNVLTVMWAIPPGKEKGYYIVVYNHQSESTFHDDEIEKIFVPGRITLPVLGWNISWWPLLAIFAAPIAWRLLWTILPIDIGAAFGVIYIFSPFIGFFLVRFIAKLKGQKKAEEFLKSDPQQLLQLAKNTLSEAAS